MPQGLSGTPGPSYLWAVGSLGKPRNLEEPCFHVMVTTPEGQTDQLPVWSQWVTKSGGQESFPWVPFPPPFKAPGAQTTPGDKQCEAGRGFLAANAGGVSWGGPPRGWGRGQCSPGTTPAGQRSA